MNRIILISAFTLLFGCGSEPAGSPPTDVAVSEEVEEPASPLDAPPEDQGFQLTFEAIVPPFSEKWVCDVLPMPNDETIAVSWVEVQQTPGTHHLTLSTLGLTGAGDVAYGRYDCNELYGDKSLMEDQIMFYGNQGDAEHAIHLPEGVAAVIPPGLDMIYEMHYVNPTDKQITLYSRLNAWTMPIEDVDEGVWGGSVRDEHINIPANATHTEWSRCVMNEDVEVLFLASHTHGLGVEFTIAPFDGQETGEQLYKNTDWHSPQIVQYDPPLVIPKGQGFEWSCTWTNGADEAVNYGLKASDEMCNMSVVFTPFDTSVSCEVVETSDGVLYKP
jgi:hypothetical protein